MDTDVEPSLLPSSPSMDEPRHVAIQSSFFIETLDAVDEAAPAGKLRSYWLDWLRVVSIYLVMCFHVSQCLAEMGLWSSHPAQLALTNYQATSLQFGMPVFFHISGRAQALAKLSSCRSMIYQRSAKLLFPAVACYFLLIPTREYMFETTDRCFSPVCGVAEGMVAQRPPWSGKDPSCRCVWTEGVPFNFGRYIVHYFTPGVYRLNVGWLWFLPALFGISVVSSPAFLFAESGNTRYCVLACISWIFQVAIAKLLFDYNWPFLFFAVFGSMVAAVTARYVPFLPREPSVATHTRESARRRWLAARALTITHMTMCVGLISNVWYRTPDGKSFQNAVGPATFLNIIFYQQGYYIQRWDAESMTMRGLSFDVAGQGAEPTSLNAFEAFKLSSQVVIMGLIFLLLCMSSPVGKMEQMIFPTYSASFEDGAIFGVMNVLGTWCYIEIAVQMFRAFCDRQINGWLYKHAAKSTIVVYIFHWMFAAVIAYWVFLPLDMLDGPWGVMDPIILFFATAAGSIGVYVLLGLCPSIGCIFGI